MLVVVYFLSIEWEGRNYKFIILYLNNNIEEYEVDDPLIIAASKWPQPHLVRFTRESNEWSWVTFLVMALGAHLHATWDKLALAPAPSPNRPLVSTLERQVSCDINDEVCWS